MPITFTETVRLIRDGEKGGRGLWGWLSVDLRPQKP